MLFGGGARYCESHATESTPDGSILALPHFFRNGERMFLHALSLKYGNDAFNIYIYYVECVNLCWLTISVQWCTVWCALYVVYCARRMQLPDYAPIARKFLPIIASSVQESQTMNPRLVGCLLNVSTEDPFPLSKSREVIVSWRVSFKQRR